MTPAKVRYIGLDRETLNGFTVGKVYDAFFVEYWSGVRNSLHVRDDSGEIKDFRPFEEFEVLSDPDDILARRSIYYNYRGGPDISLFE